MSLSSCSFIVYARPFTPALRSAAFTRHAGRQAEGGQPVDKFVESLGADGAKVLPQLSFYDERPKMGRT
jgi:hypothetical protein